MLVGWLGDEEAQGFDDVVGAEGEEKTQDYKTQDSRPEKSERSTCSSALLLRLGVDLGDDRAIGGEELEMPGDGMLIGRRRGWVRNDGRRTPDRNGI